PNGDAEMARPGMTLAPGDQLASVGHSQANISAGGGQAALLLLSDTTVGIRPSQTQAGTGAAGAGGPSTTTAPAVSPSPTTGGAATTPGTSGGGAGVLYFADLAKGVVVARGTPDRTVNVTNEKAGAIAKIVQGGAAIATDEDTGTIAV